MSNLPESHNSSLLYAEDGQPFANKKVLQAEMKTRGIEKYTIVTLDDGLAAHVETFWWVKFQAKTSTNDTDDVQLMVNGETIIVKRGERVCLPQRFLEAADNATYPQFQQLPGKPRKTIAQIQIYPYERISQASEEDYRKMITQGTQKTKEIIAKYGQDYDPERLRV